MPVVERIERALTGLESVLEALLDISRLDAGVVTPRVEAVPLDRVLATLRDTFAADAAQRGLRLRVRDTRAWAMTDPLLLERILSTCSPMRCGTPGTEGCWWLPQAEMHCESKSGTQASAYPRIGVSTYSASSCN